MEDFENLSVKIKYYKCFGEIEQGFDEIRQINIIIGKNNTGKSSLLEMINFLCANKQKNDEFMLLLNKTYKDNLPEIYFEKILSELELGSIFGESEVSYDNFRRFKMKNNLYNKKIIANLSYNNDNKTKEYNLKYKNISDVESFIEKEALSVLNTKLRNNPYYFNPFTSKKFHRLLSDRDILLEANNMEIKIRPNGLGSTNAFHRFRNSNNYPTEIITENILNDLNRIYEPEIKFTDISILENNEGLWEIYLSEQNKKEIPLSKSGSGLKTVLLVLSYIYIIPFLENKKLSDYVFAFEELENNLHPSLQRKLFAYLRDIALKEKTIFFITTHSNVVIDMFSKDELSQIVHVTHNGIVSEINSVISYEEQKKILNDLDIRASDLLQSNCVVWVEGPSDRIYFNKWIELYSNNELKEGHHYQCVFYGGKLLSHLSAKEPEIDENLIKILSVNRNPIVIMDSDKKKKNENLNETKLRVKGEIEKKEGIAWITQGKEIENYIPKEALRKYFDNDKIEQIYQYEIFSNYLNKIKKGEGKKFLISKVTFANNIQKYFKIEDLRNVLDLDEKMTKVIEIIKKWNNIK